MIGILVMFKPGDRITCITPNIRLIQGMTYTVDHVYPSSDGETYIYLKGMYLDNVLEGFYAHRFLPAIPEYSCKGNYTPEQKAVVHKIRAMEKRFQERKAA